MELFLIIAGCVLVWVAVETGKEMLIDAQHRSDDRIMAEYLKAEDARYHHQRLAAIDATVQATIDVMERIAAEAQGDVVDGTAIEVRR